MKLPGEHALPEKPRCPHCGVAFDACKGVDGRPGGPRPGDVSCCIYCGGFATFDDVLRLREMTPDEAAQLNTEGAGFPKAVAEAGVEDYHASWVEQAIREIFDRKERDA